MFTGIVEASTVVLSCQPQGTGLRLRLAAPPPQEGQGAFDVAIGDSVAVSGACLTVVERGTAGELTFDLSKETLDRTWFASLAEGRRVNLERALRFSARLDGHLVAGHVDGCATVLAVNDSGDLGRRIRFGVDDSLARYLVDKGSVTLDGVSLTVLQPRAGEFEVALIPLTLERTTLSSLAPRDRVNLEADLVGKWVERLVRS